MFFFIFLEESAFRRALVSNKLLHYQTTTNITVLVNQTLSLINHIMKPNSEKECLIIDCPEDEGLLSIPLEYQFQNLTLFGRIGAILQATYQQI